MLNLILIRNLVILLDIEEKRNIYSNVHVSYMINSQMLVIMGTQIINNITLDYRFSFPQTFITSLAVGLFIAKSGSNTGSDY